MTQLLLLEDEVRPAVVNTEQELSFTKVEILVLIKPDGQIWPQYS